MRHPARIEEAAHRKILVEPRPVNADALTDEAPVAQVLAVGGSEAREPRERNVDVAPVGQTDHEVVVDEPDADGSWYIRCRSTHAISPEKGADAR